jgi:uncharacterized protein (TIGR02453 family)
MDTSTLSLESLKFLSDLAENNNRDWFLDNKKRYQTHLKKPGQIFADQIALHLQEMTECIYSPKIYRINRDLRFTKDKTPYHAHLHISFIPAGTMTSPPHWFFGLDPTTLSLGTGVFNFDRVSLDKFRLLSQTKWGNDLSEIIADIQAVGGSLDSPELKRTPSGYGENPDNAYLLKHKGLRAWFHTNKPDQHLQSGLLHHCLKKFQQLLPFHRTLLEKVTL